MERDIFSEMERINNTLSQMALVNVRESYSQETQALSSDTTLSTLAGTASALTAAGVLTAAGALTGAGALIGALIGGSAGFLSSVLPNAKPKTETAYRTVQRQTYSIKADKYDSLVKTLSQMTTDWESVFSYNEKLTVYVALFNGLALFAVPRYIAEKLIPTSAVPEALEQITYFLDFVYHQFTCPADYSISVGNYLSPLDKSGCPDVVSLYLFIDAISRYLPDERDQKTLEQARQYYDRLPRKYKDFVLGKMAKPTSNPAVHQFLLPQLERATVPVDSLSGTPANMDYISRQLYLRLRVLVYYSEANHMSLSAKLQAIFESEKYVYQAAESVYSIQSILRDFAHTYGNMKVSRLNSIAETLFRASKKYEDTELRKMAQLVTLEAKLKHDLTVGIQLMHLRCREDTSQISQRLLNSLASDEESQQDAGQVESVKDIFDTSLRLCLYRIFYDNSDRKAEIARRRMTSAIGSFADMRRSFETATIVGDELSDNWLRQLEHPINVDSSFAEAWEDLAFYKGSFASVLLEDLLGEFLFNAFKYADYTVPIALEFWSDESFFGITMTNRIPDKMPDYIKGNGLASRKETMTFLNGADTNSVEFSAEGGIFTSTVRLRRTLFIQ